MNMNICQLSFFSDQLELDVRHILPLYCLLIVLVFLSTNIFDCINGFLTFENGGMEPNFTIIGSSPNTGKIDTHK